MDQRQIALNRANAVRIGHAEIKRAIRAGRVTAQEIIREMPETADRLPVKKLLTAIPGVGENRAYEFLGQMGMHDSKRVGELTEHQRKLFLELLG